MKDSIKSNGSCSECKAEEFPAINEKIGKNVIIDITVGRGYSRTEHLYFQCLKCGSIWQRIVDSGTGGNGTFNNRLTKNVF